MSPRDQIHALEILASVDAELKSIEDELSTETTALNELKGSVQAQQKSRDDDVATRTTTEKQRKELVGEVNSHKQQIDHSREKLARTRNEREANAVTRELEELRKLLRDKEEELGKVDVQLDALRQSLEATETELAHLEDELSNRHGAITSRIDTLSAGRAEKVAARELAAKGLPPVLYRRYEMIRGKRGVAIAQTRDGTCAACHMSLPPQMFHKLRREPSLEQCPSCHRIIYFVEPPPAIAPPGD